MKRIRKIVSVVTALSLMISGGSLTAEAAKKPKLNKKSVTVQVGKSVKLKVKNKVKKGKVIWKSKNKQVAIVSSKGKVTGKEAGSTRIICTIKKGKKKVQLKCKVKVVAKNESTAVQASSSPDTTLHPGITKIPYMTFLPHATSTARPTNSVKPSESFKPTNTPTIVPQQSEQPEETLEPSKAPQPSEQPEETLEPSEAPQQSEQPEETLEPSEAPQQSEQPEETLEPTQEPTPTVAPTVVPTVAPTVVPVKVYTGSANIQFGMTTAELQEAMGTAAYTLPAEYEGCEWYVYNADYTKFAMALVKDGEVVGAYVDGNAFSYENITTASDDAILTEEGYSKYGDKALYRKSTADFIVWAYMDSLGDNTVEGIIITKQLSSVVSAEIISAQEKISFEITNSFRAKNGLTALLWNDSAATVARNHSQDMSDNDYFSHTSLDGSSPWDRMAAAGLTYSAAAENIAWGYWDGIDASYGWINSSGHRGNMLSTTVTNLGVGIDSNCAYYTQLFYTPR